MVAEEMVQQLREGERWVVVLRGQLAGAHETVLLDGSTLLGPLLVALHLHCAEDDVRGDPVIGHDVVTMPLA